MDTTLTLKARNEERAARTAAATDGVLEYVLQHGPWREEIRASLRAMPQGIPGVYPAQVVKETVRGFGLLGLPAIDWSRFAKRMLSQLGEAGDGYRVRCHVVALEEPPVGCYRAQGDHGQAWQGDWEREPTVPEEAKWWLSPSPAITLQSYSVDEEGREFACVTFGDSRRTIPVVRD